MAAMDQISLCMIVKNEEQTLPQCLHSVEDIVSELILVDTGSTDKTIAEAKSIMGNRLKLFKLPWQDDFSEARNVSFSKATKDWILWLDADDILTNPQNLISAIRHTGNTFDVLSLMYDYAHDEYGNPVMVHWRERVFRNIREGEDSFWKWKDPVHEYVDFKENAARLAHFSESKVVHNRVDGAGNRAISRNLRILESWIEKSGGIDEATSRQLAYLGTEKWVNGDRVGAVEAYKRYLDKSDWSDEKVQIATKVCQHYREANDFERAYDYAFRALTIKPEWPDAYLTLAQLELDKKNYHNCISFAETALTKKYTDTAVVLNPLNKEYVPKALMYKAKVMLGELEEALELAAECRILRPDDQTEREYNYIQNEVNRRKFIESVVTTADFFAPNSFFQLPDSIKSEKVITDLIYEKQARYEILMGFDIVIYTGDHIEPWGPPSILEKGLGGSETAVIYLAKYLQQSGKKVLVLGEPGGYIGKHDGVTYYPADYLTAGMKCDIFVCSRRPQVIDIDIDANKKWLWLHDTNVGGMLTEDRIKKFDKFLFVSEWQKLQYQRMYGIPDEVCHVTSNGIEPSVFEKIPDGGVKDPYRFVYSSSPDRGLTHLLDMWPDIYTLYPQASLHIFYGWDNYDKFTSMYPAMKFEKEVIMKKVKAFEPLGVTMHGRINQADLYAEFMKSGLSIYASTFNETFGITVLEMLACGVSIIASKDTGALPATLNGFGRLIEGYPAYPSVKQKFIQTIKDVIDFQTKNPDEAKRLALEGAKYALSRNWESVAQEWMEL